MALVFKNHSGVCFLKYDSWRQPSRGDSWLFPILKYTCFEIYLFAIYFFLYIPRIKCITAVRTWSFQSWYLKKKRILSNLEYNFYSIIVVEILYCPWNCHSSSQWHYSLLKYLQITITIIFSYVRKYTSNSQIAEFDLEGICNGCISTALGC